MNTAGLTGAYISTVFFGYLASSYGYYLPVLYIGIMVLLLSMIRGCRMLISASIVFAVPVFGGSPNYLGEFI